MTKALYLYGGWPGHHPEEIAEWTRGVFDELGYEVEESNDIFTLDRDLTGYDLIVIGWNNAVTTETLTPSQEKHLLGAVESGVGLAGWHGAAASFRSSLPYRFLLGGDFVEHPAGEAYPQPYTVNIVNRNHPITEGVNDFDVESEQYYMHVNPNVNVLAETTFTGEHLPWIEGHTVPAAWTRDWGSGRVFYHSVGHDPSNLENDDVRRLTKQGLDYVKRDR